LAVAVTGFVAAISHRSSTSKVTMPRTAAPSRRSATRRTTRSKPDVPAQRRSELEELGLRVDDLAVAEHEAQDTRMCDALERATR
jgi:hypothetical protein